MPSNKRKSLVEVACKASSNTLSSLLPLTYGPPSSSLVFTLSIVHASELSTAQKSAIWTLYERNMRALAEPSSMGWHPREKKKELFAQESRFVLLRPLKAPDTHAKGKGKEADTSSVRELWAFTMFRFDWEECMDTDYDGDECEVLYCYELQVIPEGRRLGLGKLLVDQLLLLAKQYGMRKVMLTCLKANTSALAFYESQGFAIDPISPSRLPPSPLSATDGDTLEGDDAECDEDEDDEEECDYEILCRRVT